MAIDLMNIVQGALGGQGLRQISNMLGTDAGKTETAFGAGLPAILGGLIEQSSTPGGAQMVADSASRFDGDMLGKIAGSLGNGNHGALIQTGLGVLGSIFGARQSGLLGTISRMTGLNQGAVGSLLGLIVPMVMSAISKARREQNLDVAGVATLLASQKEQVAKAMPAQVRDELGYGGATSAPASPADGFRDTGPASPQAVRDVKRDAAHPAKPERNLLSRLIPIAAIAALAVLGYQWFAKPEPTTTTATAPKQTATAVASASSTSTPPSAPSAPAVAMPDLDVLKGRITERFGEATQAVGSITDTASAQAAADKLKGAASAIEGLNLDSLPGPAKTALGSAVGPLSKSLQDALDKAYTIPGVEAVLKPIVAPMMEKVAAFTA